MWLRVFPSTFLAVTGPKVNFCQLSVQSGNFSQLPSTLHLTFCRLIVRSQDFQTLPSIFLAAVGPFVNFPCGHGTFRHLSVRSQELTSNFMNFPYGLRIFHQILSPFHAAGEPSIYFCQCSMQLQYLLSTFGLAAGLFVNFLYGCGNLPQLSVLPLDLPSTFSASAGPPVTYRQVAMQPLDLPSTSIIFPCYRESFVHFHQLSKPLQHIPSTFVIFPCSCETFRQHSVWQ